MSLETLQRVEARPAGRMTAVMRAIAQTSGPRVLRVGVVHGGKVVEERVLTARTHVTIGTSETCTFQLAASLAVPAPASFRLFEVGAEGYRLNWLEGMSGRVAHETGIQELATLRALARPVTASGLRAHQIALGDTSRGKVVVGDTTFLFQLVAPPPPRTKPQLPSSVTRGHGIDWVTTIIAAFSFLLHFGLVGSIYSDWMDPLLDDEARTAQLVESLRQLPPPPATETPVDAASEAPAATSAPTTAPATARAPASPSRGEAGPAGDRRAVTDARASAIAQELATLDVAMLTALRGGGPSTARVLEGSDVPTALLDGAAASDSRVGLGGQAALRTGSGGVVRPGEAGRSGLGTIGDTGRGDGPVTQGTAQVTRGPSGTAAIGPTQPTGGSVANAAAVVARMQAGFRRCYNRELPNAPDMKGSVRITAKIGPNGEVAGASASGVTGLSASLVACVTSRVASAQFAAPEGGGATLVIPVSFFPQ